MAEILSLLRLGEAGKTEVMYTVRLSHLQTQKYLGRLTELRLIEQSTADSRPSNFHITPRGLNLLGKIESLQETLNLRELSGIVNATKVATEEKSRRNIVGRIVDAIRLK